MWERHPCSKVYASEHPGTTTATVASWSADDFESVVDELRAKGVTFETYGEPATDERGVHTYEEHKVVWFKDPDGNTCRPSPATCVRPRATARPGRDRPATPYSSASGAAWLEQAPGPAVGGSAQSQAAAALAARLRALA